ncbi:MAG: CARDB domain-containing protein [Bacillota bacterium]
MDTTQNHDHETQQTRKAAVGGLAVVGFIALILIGIATAIYAASFLPRAISRVGTANVYLSTLFQPNDGQPSENPQPPASTSTPTSIPLSPAPATTTAPAPSIPSTPSTPAPTPVTPTYTQPTYQVVTVPGTQYYGLADLVTTITSVGYLRNEGDTSSFVTDDTVPSGYQGAVRFVIANRGTNISNSWMFEAHLPTTDGSSVYRSGTQRALNPGDTIVYTLGFDNADRGSETIRVEADANNRVAESNENNNTDSASIYLNGSSSSSSRDYDSNGNYCRYGTYYRNGHYYCETSSQNNDSYDSNGNYCRYGTYYSNGRYYCESSNQDYDSYDSNGNYCRYGTYYSNGRYYCY